MPGNICVDSTVTVKTRLPRKLWRLTAYAANTAITTEQTVAAPATISEFTKYRASGIVDQMSMYGRIVSSLGSQRNSPETSASGFSELETMT